MDYDSLYREKGILQKGVSNRVAKAVKFFKKEGLQKILDLGCGTGRHTACLLKEGFEAFGCDSSKEALKIAKKTAPKAKFKRCKMTSLPYKGKFFSGIICNQVIQHGKMLEIKKTVSEMQRVLQKGGMLYLAVISTKHQNYSTGKEIEPNTRIGIDSEDGFLPHHFFSEEEMKTLFKEFKKIKLQHFEEESELNPGKKSAILELYAKKA